MKPLDVVHFPALRGVRRERLRREADEARTRVAAGQAVRLTHVVELPAFQPDKTDAIDGARSMSPAVGEAARKYAPDIPVSRVLTGAAWDKATDPSYRLAQAPITEPPTPPAPIVLEKSDPGAAPAPVAPVVITTPPPQVQTALGLGRRPLLKRWQVMALAAIAAAVAGLVFRPQPPTDKKDAPWLKEERPAPAASKKVPDALPGQPPLAPAPASPAATPPAPAPAVTTASVVVTPDATAYGKALEQGESLLSRGKYRAAVGELKRAAKLRPESVPALLALGDAYLEANLPKSALGPLEGAARIDAKSSRAQLLLGTAYQSLGRNGDAVKAYGRYLELEPEGKFARDVNVILANLKR